MKIFYINIHKWKMNLIYLKQKLKKLIKKENKQIWIDLKI